MEYRISASAVVIFFAVLTITCTDSPPGNRPIAGFEALSGPYLGQEPPGTVPQLFMPGLITTHWSDTYIAFLNEARVCVYSTITDEGQRTYYTYEKNGRWTPPQRAPFEELQGHPNYTGGPKGRKIYFHSGRPTHAGDTRQDDNTWAIEWTGDGWAEPYPLPAPANSDYGEAYPSVTDDGTVYFFSWRRSDTRANDVYFSRCIEGDYQETERLPWPINTDYLELDPYVAPDESFLIFVSLRPGGYGSGDNYICFRREDGSWTHPINLGDKMNSPSGDGCPSGTPDGKYLFFTSGRKTEIAKGKKSESPDIGDSKDRDFYWVDASVIDDLREVMLTRRSAAEAIQSEYRANGIEAAADKLSAIYPAEEDSYYFSLYELLTICEEMMAAGKADEAEQFYRALLNTLPHGPRIKHGYAIACVMSGLAPRGLELMKDSASEDSLFSLEDTLAETGYLLSLYPEKTDEALAVLEFTVQEFPDSSFAYYSLARIYRDRGDIEQAIEHCRKAVELRPNMGYAVELLERLEQQR